MARVRSVLRLARVTGRDGRCARRHRRARQCRRGQGRDDRDATASGSPASPTSWACSAGLEPRELKGARLRRAAPRHRQDRRLATRSCEARPADRRGVGRDAPATRSSASGSASRWPPRRSSRRSSATTTSAGTAPAIRTACAASRSRSAPGSSASSTPSTRSSTSRPYRAGPIHEEPSTSCTARAAAQFDPGARRALRPADREATPDPRSERPGWSAARRCATAV